MVDYSRTPPPVEKGTKRARSQAKTSAKAGPSRASKAKKGKGKGRATESATSDVSDNGGEDSDDNYDLVQPGAGDESDPGEGDDNEGEPLPKRPTLAGKTVPGYPPVSDPVVEIEDEVANE